MRPIRDRERRRNYYVLHDYQGRYLARRVRGTSEPSQTVVRDLSAAWFTLDSTTAYELAYLLGMHVQRLVMYE